LERTEESHELRSRSTIRIEQHSLVAFFGIWAWLFTIGFLHLTFWKAVLAILLWPYYLGVHFTATP
jgi:hypothetical protein